MAAQAVGTDEGRTPTSWLARQLRLWSRTLEPVRPLHAPAGRTTARHSSWPLTHELTSVGRARRLVTAQAGGWGLGDLADTLELLVSELVTNALRHARGPVRLNLRIQDAFLRCEVEDISPRTPVRRIAGSAAEGGRGIDILALLSDAWGTDRTATGKTTWFELTVPAA
ncbi:ATP-binding protein [Actinacidiphila glaucinigra]|uniref:ATP-binding protein n=1 Tax=Actinacidiphila glaucinigra TaxID=235986 RepID=UPI002DD91E21|nr:ATP-binding protein [Actinacidiphila glaucinigra]WSD64341.1 ATP-binding protein [Actinacidiphila glaucinigra]